MPKQNRPLVRDGRIQTKKRTERSYLRPAAEPAPPDEAALEAAETSGEPDAVAEAIASSAPQSAPAASPATGGRLPSRVRAMQQQGVRKRREVDLNALAVNDTRYAMHELRRIAILATMVVATLIILTIVLR